jgi:plastocyanin
MRLDRAHAAAAARTHRIGVARVRFGAVPAGIKAGDTILWVNADVVPHTATARDGSFDMDLPPRRSGRMLIRQAGRFAFYCRHHPAMRGTLTVAAR